MNFDLNYIEKLAKLLKDNDLSEITIDDEEQAISLKREKTQPVINEVVKMPVSQPLSSAKQERKVDVKTENKGKPIVSPMVGTFYSSPSPDDAPFVNTGDNVTKGQVVCIIEAMKLMNEIEAEVSGQITEICVKNGDSVEFGQVLMYVK